ncbi:helix-turn-helix domain-containing protein [Amycolatopsis orientalis]|uniref:helix-turn-helix domain-containing protein n=1 Tax=Amycolatopsis orientalis TaxID=31958 RepID=UPI000D12B23F
MPSSPRTRILGTTLRSARIEANFGLRELARRIGIAPAVLSSWEQARRIPNISDVACILGAIGATGHAKRDILRLASGTPGESWVVHGAPLSPARTTALLTHGLAAHSVVTWNPLVIPELLHVIHQRPEPCSTPIEAFISDRAFDADDTSVATLRRQLHSLPRSATSGSQLLTLRIVQAELAWRSGLITAFDRYSMPDGGIVIYYSQRDAGILIADQDTPPSHCETDIKILRKIAHPQI